MTLNHGLSNLGVSHDTLLQWLPADPADSAWTDNHTGAGSRVHGLFQVATARLWLPLHHHTAMIIYLSAAPLGDLFRLT